MSTQNRRPIVVGVDASPSNRLALAWGADEALRRHLPLRLVHALDWPPGATPPTGDPPPWQTWSSLFRTAGEQTLRDAASFVADRHPGLAVEADLVDGTPTRVLREASLGAELVVLASRRLSSVHEALTTGSVAVPVSAHSPCPVVVVREAEHVTQWPPFLAVGVDGSAASEAAVSFAFEEASLRGADLVAVYAWRPWTHRVSGGVPAVFDQDASGHEARRLVAESLAGWTEKYPDVPVRHELVRGHPVQVLTKASAHALALVVGTRGRGGFAGMLLGSVSQGVVHHARCPVVVVPDLDRVS